MKIIHIVDSLPFYVGGVSDYAYKLSSELLEKHKIDTFFITVNSFSNYDKSLFNKIYNIHREKNLFETVTKIIDENFEKEEKVKIILEYVGYGYQKRGCPLWLLSELKKLKKSFPKLQLITMFHELYAISKNPKTSTFWLQGLQKYITKSIFHLSNEVKTNTIKYRDELQTWDTSKNIDVLPVFSNVGEPKPVCSFNERENSAVIFGSLPSRRRVYELPSKVLDICQELGIDKIYDIGPGKLTIPDVLQELVESKGKLDVHSLELIFEKAKYGLLDYENMPLDKSGIFAAYAAFGIVPIVFKAYTGECVYKNKEHFVYSDQITPQLNFDDLSRKLYSIYAQKAVLNHHVESFLKAIQ